LLCKRALYFRTLCCCCFCCGSWGAETSRETHISAKNPYISLKSPVYPQKSPVSMQKSSVYVQNSLVSVQKSPEFAHVLLLLLRYVGSRDFKRDLHIRERALFLCKRALNLRTLSCCCCCSMWGARTSKETYTSGKEPCLYAKEPCLCAKEPCFHAKEP